MAATLPSDRPLPDMDPASPAEIVTWAASTFGDGLVTTASFGDAVLVHLVATHAPGTRIVLIDTQYLFPETLWYARDLSSRVGANLEVVGPDPSVRPDQRWRDDVEGCCAVRKVEPLGRALAGASAWISGLRRADGAARAGAPVLSWNEAHQVIKVNPLAFTSDEDVDRYHLDHDLPHNPLTERGYPSIGCWPCTRPVAAGQDPRSGRWADSDKTECGLHLEPVAASSVSLAIGRSGDVR
ncbi:MAG: phosphoadenylyl-sulfate reductase [Actinobacteria bacterium]|nr:phosphoadenylyl-sulfate reductase [Actinomycetota bacterium]